MHHPLDPRPVREAPGLFPRAAFDVVAIAASTGGVRALRTLRAGTVFIAPPGRHLVIERRALVPLCEVLGTRELFCGRRSAA